MENRISTENRNSRLRRRKKALLFRRTAVAVILMGIIAEAVFLCHNCVMKSASAAADTSVIAEADYIPEEESIPEELDTAVPEEIVISTAVLHDDPDLDALEYPFNQMSSDWSSEDLNGWWRYTIPEKYEKIGGYLPDLVQVYTYCLCKKYGIRYPLVLALMEFESGYQYDATSSAGDIGYLQVNYKWQIDKMADLKEKALYNPYVNISVGIEYLVELSEEFDTEEAVLTAYHYGPAGAYSRCFNDRTITSEYATKVMEIADRIESELEDRENEVNRVNGGTENAE